MTAKPTATGFWVVAAAKTCLIFSPVAVALYFVWAFERGGSDALLSFNNIPGNSYLINDVLLVFIGASYAVVFIGLIFYAWDIISDLSGYLGSGSSVRRLNTFGLALLGTVFAVLLIYVVVVAIALLFGIERLVTVPRLVLVNKCLSLFIFVAFLGADLLGWRSQVVQERENERRLASAIRDGQATGSAEYDKTKGHLDVNRFLKKFAQDATFFVNLPTLLLNMSILLLTIYLDQADRFRGVVDAQLHFYEARGAIAPETFSLFVNGVETGAIVSTIVFSQFIYLMLKTKCEWNIRTLSLSAASGSLPTPKAMAAATPTSSSPQRGPERS